MNPPCSALCLHRQLHNTGTRANLFIINPLALKQGKRFIDENFNRSFRHTRQSTTIEAQRAKVLNQYYAVVSSA